MNEVVVSKHRFTSPHGSTHSSSFYSHRAMCIFLCVWLKKERCEWVCLALTWIHTAAESFRTSFFFSQTHIDPCMYLEKWQKNKRVASWKTLMSFINFVSASMNYWAQRAALPPMTAGFFNSHGCHWRPATLCHRAVIKDLLTYGCVISSRVFHARWSFYSDSCQLLSPFKWF